MAIKDLREFIALIEAKGQLRRVSAAVDPKLEIGEITDRVSKQFGPGCCSSTPCHRASGDPYAMPVAINLMGSYERMAWALGVDAETGTWRDLDAKAQAAHGPAAARHARVDEGQVRRPGEPQGPRDCRRERGQAGQGAGAAGRAARRRGRPDQAPGADHVAGGRRAVHHASARRDEQPQGPPQRRHVPAAGLRPEHHGSAHPRAPRRRQEPAGVEGRRRAAGSGERRARRRPRHDLLGDRARAADDRRVPVQRHPARRAGRGRQVHDQRPHGARARRDRARGLVRSRRRRAGRARSATTPATTRSPTTSRSSTSRRSRCAGTRSTRRPSWAGRPWRTATWPRPPSGSSCRSSRR